MANVFKSGAFRARALAGVLVALITRFFYIYITHIGHAKAEAYSLFPDGPPFLGNWYFHVAVLGVLFVLASIFRKRETSPRTQLLLRWVMILIPLFILAMVMLASIPPFVIYD